MKQISTAITLTVTLACAAGASNASITDHLLYEQLSPTTQGSGASVYYSNPHEDQIMYDRYTAAENESVLGIGFWGAFYRDTIITISVYEQDTQSGLLGALAHEQQFLITALDPAISGTVVDEVLYAEEQHAIAEFDQPFTTQRGQSYWIAITGDGEFSWTYDALSGSHNTLYSNTAQDSYWTNADLGRDPTNLAFSVYGTPIPGPATSVVLLGLLGFQPARRRKSC